MRSLSISKASECHLCALPIIGKTYISDDRSKRFCSQECLKVYEIANKRGLDLIKESRAYQHRVSWPKESISNQHLIVATIDGMYCPSCALLIKACLMKLPGIIDVNVNYISNSARIYYDPSQIKEEDIALEISALGYTAYLSKGDSRKSFKRKYRSPFMSLSIAGMLTALVMLIDLVVLYPAYSRGTISRNVAIYEYIALAFTTPVQFLLGWSILRDALKSIQAWRITSDALLSVSSLTAYFYSIYATFAKAGPVYFAAAAMITTIAIAGRSFENLAKRRLTDASNWFNSLLPDQAWLIKAASIEAIPTDDIEPGMHILVRPGERVPIDGVIVEGSSVIDESALSGEISPISKTANDKVIAGTLNMGSNLAISAQTTKNETIVKKIIRIIEGARSSKAYFQDRVDRIAAFYIPFLLIIALFNLANWYITSSSLVTSLISLIAVLIAGCACCLGFKSSLSTSFFLDAALRQGILVRDIGILERANSIKNLVLGKTGVITNGKFAISNIYPASPEISPSEVLLKAAGAESFSHHPIARAITQAVSNYKLPICVNFKVEAEGINGKMDGELIHIGSERYIESKIIFINEKLRNDASECRRQGQTVVFVANRQRALGIIGLADEIKTSTHEAISQLKDFGISLHILSSDDKRTVSSIGRRIGIESVYADVLKEDKFEPIEKLQRTSPTGMVSDGISDYSALTQADLRISLGNDGVDSDLIDAIVLNRKLTGISDLVKLSRRTVEANKQNLWISLGLSVIAVAAATAGFLTPITAAALAFIANLLIIANSLKIGNLLQTDNSSANIIRS
ncbi:MAG: cation-translocating P-type ATPase [Actinomycetota bacterium]|nr:cation-translocating P-type ATPase [Actinomycetota bacterium]